MMPMAAIHDIRFERLSREAPDRPLALCPEDWAYVARHFDAVGEAFDVAASPAVPLSMLTGRALARHLARVRASVVAETLEQHLALGRLESVYRLLASVVRLAGRGQGPERRQS